MTSIKRLFVEKKEGQNIEAKNLLSDLKENLNINSVENVRVVNCYDIQGLDEVYLESCKKTIFSEPPSDTIYEEILPMDENEIKFGVKYLPGQYDQRADSCEQCIQIITGKDTHIVESSKIYILRGKNISVDELIKIENYLINPVDSMKMPDEKPKSLKRINPEPEDIKIHENFINKTKEELLSMHSELGLAMSPDDLMFCQDYFKEEKRNPTFTEIKVIDTYWSDHCRHTTFLTELLNIEFKDGLYKNLFENTYKLYLNERNFVYEGKDRAITLMDIATIGMKALKKKGYLNDLDESDEINACSIVTKVNIDGKNEDYLIMFKNETHNHPTEIEPFGGAATCLGGAIRDPLSGRSYVYQAMRVTGSGDPRKTLAETLPGKLPQRKITKGAASGYSSYGNQIGLATGFVREIYDEGYVAKRMEIGAVVGAAKKENVVRSTPVPGDKIIVVGGRTGRDGCGGATGSSKEHTEDSINECGAEVQKGNAPTERKLQRLFRNPDCAKLIKKCNDFGAGGVSVAISELSDGVTIDLDKLLKKYEGLDGTELAISESQERMAVVLDKDHVSKFMKYADEENLESYVVADVTQEENLIMKWRNKEIVNIKRSFLNSNGVKASNNVTIVSPDEFKNIPVEGKDLKEKWLNNLSSLNVSSQKGLVERFDSTVGAGTVLMPFGGKNQITPVEAMAALVPVENGNITTTTLMSFGYNPKFSKWSPFHGALLAVVESIDKIVAAGGDYKKSRLSFQEYFERLGTDPTKWGKPFIALLGSVLAQLKLNIPSIGGKDSMSGTFKDMNVPPTLVSFALCVSDSEEIISPEFKNIDSNIILLETNYTEENIPDFEILTKNYEFIYKEKSSIKAVSTIGFGGIGASVTKMCLGNHIGANISYDDLFTEKYGSFVIEYAGDLSKLEGYNYVLLGKTTENKEIKVNDTIISLEEAFESYVKPLEKIFETLLFESPKNDDLTIKIDNHTTHMRSKTKFARPHVFVPVFPGTNCELDVQKSFVEAGAEVEVFVFNNLTVKKLEESIKKAVEIINNSQILMIPGGFSAGDEPDGSGKFIAAVFRNKYIEEAVMNLLYKRDGLALGICNGFQALVKLGLLPYGKIQEMSEKNPTLTFNKIGRHISCIANTKVISNKSPWLSNSKAGEVYKIPVSHGEGRFLCDEDVLKELIKNNQIATQYVDFNGNPTYETKFNPNGSYYAIEGITSIDGRILGRMGHSDRLGDNLYKNIDGNWDNMIFKSGVDYYS